MLLFPIFFANACKNTAEFWKAALLSQPVVTHAERLIMHQLARIAFPSVASFPHSPSSNCFLAPPPKRCIMIYNSREVDTLNLTSGSNYLTASLIDVGRESAHRAELRR